MANLYRQYRPQRFSDVAGQDHITATLQNAINKGGVAHAYLFHGARGTGKTTTARILARRLNCQTPEGAEPCGTCATCVAAREHRLLDVIEIDAASNRGIDDIRALQEGIGLHASVGAYKVYIIDEVHMLTKEAFTALLKTLEEPAEQVVFILASTEFHKIPDTIISRCQVFHFRRASEADLQKRLRYLLKQEKRSVDDAALSFIIARSEGCYRDAESLLGQALTLHQKTITYEDLSSFLGLPPHTLLDQWLTALIRGDSAAALAAVDQVLELGFDAEHFIQESIRAARDGALRLIKQDTTSTLFTFHTTPGALTALPVIIRALVQAMQDVAFVPEPSVALHVVIVTVCQPKASQPTSTTTSVSARTREAPSAPPKAAQPLRQTQPTAQPMPATPAKPLQSMKVAGTTLAGQKNGVTEVTEAWPQVIDRVKEKNPVAATFLRALKPLSYRDGIVQIEARYSLHKSFFEKPDNQQLLNAMLSEILGASVTVRCILQEAPKQAATGGELKQQEQALMSAVQEVFGK